MTSSARRKAVREAVPGITHLSGFEADPGMAAVLLKALQTAVRPPRPETLGSVPDSHMTACLDAWHGAGSPGRPAGACWPAVSRG